jgi:hypothetical protein
MTKLRLISTSLLVGFAVTLPAASSQARAVPRRIAALASNSVLAVEARSEMRTAFAFGASTTALASAPAGVDAHLVDASGRTSDLDVARREGELVLTRLSGLRPTPLRASSLRRIRAGTAAYVLGPPLGYEAGRLRFVRLPPIALARTRRAVIEGALPRAFRGAPVVTEGGRLIGAVATVGHGRWTLEPGARLTQLLASAQSSGAGGGLPTLVILAVALAILSLAGGLVVARARRRQRRAFAAAASARAAGTGDRPTSAQPLVRLRDAEQPSPVEEQASSEDFEVLIKSRESS